MNSFSGHITQIKVSGGLSLVTVEVAKDLSLQTIVVETPDTAQYLKENNSVNVLFKETEVIIGVGDNKDVSLQNRISGNVIEIDKGALISKVVMETELGELGAVISTNAVENMSLKKGSTINALIKLNEIMLSE